MRGGAKYHALRWLRTAACGQMAMASNPYRCAQHHCGNDVLCAYISKGSQSIWASR